MPQNCAQADAMTQFPHPGDNPDSGTGPSIPVPPTIYTRHTVEDGEIVEQQYIMVGAFKVPLFEYRAHNANDTPRSIPSRQICIDFLVAINSDDLEETDVQTDPSRCPSRSSSPILEEEETEPREDPDTDLDDNSSSSARQLSPPPQVLETMGPLPLTLLVPMVNHEAAINWAVQEAGITTDSGRVAAKRKI
ncbi:OLC1v1005513C1 [Oldenlandia corymbosa var. corymbosa]|uniref:OLC1v1005513C1 n=1 Tax=Oldenlandia corymbosa var. corymbosa TaxID=529605 RepID=A0AAV1DH81_OLDCO|nr:OLC1v1005513C1 [Oldenlandia corymbosa var. corymbosa]